MTKYLFALLALFFAAAPQFAGAYTIAPGDTLQIEVVEDNSLNRTALVLPDGTITFPGAGTVKAAGTTPAAVRERIAAGLSVDFSSTPTVYVSVVGLAAPGDKLANANNIYIMGEVNNPGLLQTQQQITLLQAIAMAGGFTRFSANKRIELHRMNPSTQSEEVYLFDYKNRRGISGATLLKEGDVIVVPERRLFE
ncbi:polysaccharide biosynthesis/export family protein [Thioclava kandeliae]|uniref:Polysaccharide biosynthesis/export family protein n=1 Tax=Thioclava kandeliae TaxID=3070818 RepID=A0ABV1SMN3_9RHOB